MPDLTPDQRLTRARRAGLAWLGGAVAVLATQVALRLALGDDNPIDGPISGAWATCAIFGFERLGWTRGYREGRTDSK